MTSNYPNTFPVRNKWPLISIPGFFLFFLCLAGCSGHSEPPRVPDTWEYEFWEDDVFELDEPEPPVVASVDIEAMTTLVIVDDVLRLAAIVRADGSGDHLTDRLVTWESSAPAVASVSPNGLVIGKEVGTVIITAHCEGVSDSIGIEVIQKPVGRVEMVRGLRIIMVGDTLQLEVRISADDGTPLDDRERTWSSSDPTIASVNRTGLVTGISDGRALISVTSEGISADTELRVSYPGVGRLELQPMIADLIKGEQIQLTAVVIDDQGNQYPNPAIQWSTANSLVAATDQNGLVIARGEGETSITAESGDVSDFARIRVTFDFSRIEAGGRHTCATVGDIAYCWGDNTMGQLGQGSTEAYGHPNPVSGNLRFASISAGEQHTCGINQESELYCWGANDDGQLGNGTFQGTNQPIQIGNNTFELVEAGSRHTCGIDENKIAWCWGDNSQGQLGIGNRTASLIPVRVSTLGQVKNITAGARHSCAIELDGTGYCWGANNYGQLGTNTTLDQNVPSAITGGFEYFEIQAGEDHTCGITQTGSTACWGANEEGQIGDGTNQNRQTPILVPLENAFSRLGVGLNHTCGIGRGQTVCWGDNASGQLGRGTTTDSSRSQSVNSTESFFMISSGNQHSCAINEEGDLFCWGRGAEMQLGTGLEGSLTPVSVQGL